MEVDNIKTVFEGGEANVVLGMPTEISFASGYGWERVELGLTGIAADWIQGMGPSNVQEVQEGIKQMFMRQFAQTNAFNTGSLYAKNNLKAPNPKEAVLFRGVSHREFQMMFNIASDEESDMRRILTELNGFYKACAPEVVDDGLFFKYPDTFQLRIMDGSSDIIAPRKVAVTTLEANLNPQGVFAVFEGGTPVNINLQVGCIELNLPTKATDAEIFRL